MADSFTVFEKFGDVCAELEEEDRKELIYAINMYGMYGETVELPYLLKALFVSLKEDIDNSKSARTRGSRGGRPKAKPEVSESEKPEVSESAKPEVSEPGKPEVSEVSRKTESQTKPNQYKPNQTNTSQTKGEEGGSRRRFTPPTPEEVAAYAEERGERIDAHRFCDYHASRGWVVGRNPMRDWRAAVRTWLRNEAEWASGRKGAEDDAELDVYAALVS